VVPLTVDLWATSNLFRAGHRIRVVVNSSCFPRFDVNPGTGESGATASRRVKAENQIYLDPQYPSHLVLPVRRGK
jgi:putative CocE/NonD family hydrolase